MTTPTHTCYTVRDRGENKKAFWVRIGSAWTNRDGSFNLVLDAMPIDGKITVRPCKKGDDHGSDELPM